MNSGNRYERIIGALFAAKFRPGLREVPFEREDIERVATRLKVKLPKNLGDILYSFRYRAELPESVRNTAPAGESWIIRPAGRAKYCFVLAKVAQILPNAHLAEINIPDATPGVISMYALNDEQALLAKLRYNRLVDLFTGVTCYSLQSHLRTSVPNLGQVETDELYVGIDRSGAHFVLPVQAKGGRDQLSVVQIEQDIALCAAKFPGVICRPLGAQFIRDDLIALFAFVREGDSVAVEVEKHYRLTPHEQITAEDLSRYRAELPR